MKVGIFFALAFGWVVVPFAVAAVFALLGPPPYVAVGEGPGDAWAEGRTFDDGTRVRAHGLDSEAAAKEALATSLTGLRMDRQSSGAHARSYRTTDGTYGRVVRFDRFLVHVDGPTREAVDARFDALAFVAENPRANPLWRLVSGHFSWVIGGLGVYSLCFLLFLARGGAWAARVPPLPVAPVTEDALAERLAALDGLGLPFQVRPVRPGRWVAEWRIADAAWAGPLEAGGLTRVHRVHLDLDPSDHRVRVVDTHHRVDWRGGVGALRGGAAFFRGIEFARYERGLHVGVLFDPDAGLKVAEGFDYRFQLSEMKGPLIDVVTGSGWTWAPVVTFFRPIGG